MLPPQTNRTALGLYGALLVLPTLVFGWLYWRELVRDYEVELATVPEDAEDGARRIREGLKTKVEEFLQAENERGFHLYAPVYSAEDVKGDSFALRDSPLVRDLPARGILGWFSYDAFDPEAPLDVFVGGVPEAEARAEELRTYLREYRATKEEESMPARLRELDGLAPATHRMWDVAVHRGWQHDPECLRACGPLMEGLTLQVQTSAFRLEFYLDEAGRPHAYGTRRVILLPQEGTIPAGAECLEPMLLGGFNLRQGFILDVDWLFDRLPRSIAQQVLPEDQRLKEAPVAGPLENIGTVFAQLLPVTDLGFSARSPEERLFGKLEVEIDPERIRARFAGQSRKFLAVALMLVLTLVIAISLLYRSVKLELEQAHRMQNFVAAVTHELRTPLSAIRLHGEMLLDGWASDPAQQREYYGRIVRETNRLSTLVENVLEKSRLKERNTAPEPGDLNAHVERAHAGVQQLGAFPGDVELDLAPDLPLVWLIPDGIVGILTNLVENARKYAPPRPGEEPILVRTHREGDRVLLEVADRGPGFPASERDRIFEAFYRVGSETTRRTTGTGLGLHLVDLHARAAGAEASALARDGGGSIFRVAFRVA
ncbi:MAG: HAMP domain-containing sensor histidine kinase [Planctomycetota bacterium]